MNSLSWRVVSLPIHTLKRETKMNVDLFHPLKRRFLSGNPQISSFYLRFLFGWCISSLQLVSSHHFLTEWISSWGKDFHCIWLRSASPKHQLGPIPQWCHAEFRETRRGLWSNEGGGPPMGKTAGRHPTVTRFKEVHPKYYKYWKRGLDHYIINWLVVEPTHLNNMSQIKNVPQIENKKYLKPPLYKIIVSTFGILWATSSLINTSTCF